MIYAVSTYSFHRALRSGAIAFLDIPAAVRDMGFDALEFAQAGLPEGETTSGMARKLKAKCEAVGLPIVNYTVGADFVKSEPADEIDRLRGEVDTARLLGVNGMRHDAASGPKPEDGIRTFDDALPRIAGGCREVAEYAAQFGIRTMVENHGFFVQESRRVERLVTEVGHPNFGLLIDIGNFLCADDDPALAVGRLAPYAFHVHIKDFFTRSGQRPDPGEGWFMSRGGNFLRGTIVGHGDVSVGQCVCLLRRAGYDGALSIEFEGMEDNLHAVRLGLDCLKRLSKE